jgi:hypothetical protein
MKKVIMGHRGVGKTSLLKRHALQFIDVPHFDLDQEVENRHKIKIIDFFKNKTEAEFRDLEIKTYQQIKAENKSYVIALGAGFLIENIDSEDEVLFVSRVTDSDGRFFLNRPRLDLNINALTESVQRYHLREIRFRNRADFIYYMPEGAEYKNAIEPKILQYKFVIEKAYYTLNKNELKNISQILKNYKQIELRTDLIEKNDILKITKQYRNHDWLISIRDSEKFEIDRKFTIDCDTQYLSSYGDNYSIVSTHTNELSKALAEVKPFENRCHIKLCPMIVTFEELKLGHAWQSQDPQNRSFLPRSQNAKWNWYRLLGKFQQKLNFIRGFNEQSDQPTVFQWLSLPNEFKNWACVMGQPIHFSRSPLMHHDFFQTQKTYITAINLSEEEFKKNINWLQQLGLNQAAVTSPLKDVAFAVCSQLSETAEKLKSVNTLFFSNDQISGHNTDLDGFEFLIQKNLDVPDSQTAVWGGGGTLPVIKKVLPTVNYYSSQTGQLRNEIDFSIDDPEVLIWAAPRMQKTLWPLKHWKIKKIIDLNYAETSMGLEYAQQLIEQDASVQYVSGLDMFHVQARKQQDYWSKK